jgi:hypothetical protein
LYAFETVDGETPTACAIVLIVTVGVIAVPPFWIVFLNRSSKTF